MFWSKRTLKTRLELDVCARAELIIRRLNEIGDGGPIGSELFRAMDQLAEEGVIPEDDVCAVNCALFALTGERMYV